MEDNLEEYTFGHPYYGDIPKESIEKYAVMFGEGSKSLTDLLRFCFQNNIKTYTSCKGHKDGEEAYIGFLPDEEFAKYLCEIADQLMVDSIEIDKYHGKLRTNIYCCNELDFREILKLVQKYVLLKKQGYIYSTRFKDTERLIQTIISSNNPKLCLQIRNGESKLYDFSIDRTIERGYYCPNASITHILHTKISRELEKAFVSSHDKRKREILLEKKR